jgi:hypothetical protein
MRRGPSTNPTNSRSLHGGRLFCVKRPSSSKRRDKHAGEPKRNLARTSDDGEKFNDTQRVRVLTAAGFRPFAGTSNVHGGNILQIRTWLEC